MEKKVDLHTHSTASDGQYSPSELVRLAKDKGLEVIALTDHDTMDGLEEAEQAGRELGIRVIRGIELSAREYHTFHILGYGFTPDGPELSGLCRRMKEARDQRVPRLLGYLRDKGVELTLGEVEKIAGGQIIARPHFAQAMVRRGIVSSNREAFERYLDTEEFHQKVERVKPTAAECISAIKAAGGNASLAHPYQIGLADSALDALVSRLAGSGLDAIECYYPKHTPAQEEFYLRLAEKNGLRITGGSDFHGEQVKPDVRLAAWEMDVDWLDGGQ